MKVSLTTTLHPTNYTTIFFVAPIGDYRLHAQIKMSQDIRHKSYFLNFPV